MSPVTYSPLSRWNSRIAFRVSRKTIALLFEARDVSDQGEHAESLRLAQAQTKGKSRGDQHYRRELGLGYGIPSFDVLANSTICTIVKEIQLSRPELAFIIATRAILAAGIALLLADRLNAGQRKAVGSTLALVGLVTTIPAVWAIFGGTSKSVEA
jgi:hypothetical protein